MGAYDLTLRTLSGSRPQDYIGLVTGRTPDPAEVRVFDPKLPESERTADSLVRDRTFGRVLVHLEFQLEFRRDIVRRMLEYRIRIASLHRARSIYSAVVYLTRDRHPPDDYNRLEESAFGERQLTFQFKEIRLWELSANEFLQSGMTGLLPLLPLMKDADKPLMERTVRLADRNPDQTTRDKLMAGLAVFGSLTFQKEYLRRLFRSEAMRRNPFLEELEQTGIEKGRVMHGRESVLRVLRNRFKRVPREVSTLVNKSDSPDRLDEMLDRAVACRDIKDFAAAFAD